MPQSSLDPAGTYVSASLPSHPRCPPAFIIIPVFFVFCVFVAPNFPKNRFSSQKHYGRPVSQLAQNSESMPSSQLSFGLLSQNFHLVVGRACGA